jgi:hypothetical protein
VNAEHYIEETFRFDGKRQRGEQWKRQSSQKDENEEDAAEHDAAESIRPRFRVIPASTFLCHFASDRRHMRRKNVCRDDDLESYPNQTSINRGGKGVDVMKTGQGEGEGGEGGDPDGAHLDPELGEYLAPPPPWPPICGELALPTSRAYNPTESGAVEAESGQSEMPHTLGEFMDVRGEIGSSSPRLGTLLDRQSLLSLVRGQ